MLIKFENTAFKSLLSSVQLATFFFQDIFLVAMVTCQIKMFTELIRQVAVWRRFDEVFNTLCNKFSANCKRVKCIYCIFFVEVFRFKNGVGHVRKSSRFQRMCRISLQLLIGHREAPISTLWTINCGLFWNQRHVKSVIQIWNL